MKLVFPKVPVMLRYGIIRTDVVALWTNSYRPMGSMYFCHWTNIITLDNIPCHQYGAKPFSLSMMSYLDYVYSNFNETLNHLQEFSFEKHLLLECCMYDASDPFYFTSIALSRSRNNSAVSWNQGWFYGCSTGQLAWHTDSFILCTLECWGAVISFCRFGKGEEFRMFHVVLMLDSCITITSPPRAPG